MGQSLNFFFTGNYNGNDNDNNITAIGFAGTVRAYGGNDSVTTASFYTKVEDTWGNLDLWGLNGGIDIRKSGEGSIYAHALAVSSQISHWGRTGDVNFYGGALRSDIRRAGESGNANFYGAAASSYIEHKTLKGDTTVNGLLGQSTIVRDVDLNAIRLDSSFASLLSEARTTLGAYYTTGSQGTVTLNAGAADSKISSNMETGDVIVRGAFANSNVYRNGKTGNVSFYGASASSNIEHNTQYGDTYLAAAGISNIIKRNGINGNVTASGAAGYNQITMNVDQGDLTVGFVAGANVITRSGLGSSSINVGGVANIITTGNSDDNIFALGGANIIKAGYKGNDNITAAGGVNVLHLGHGNNTVSAIGGANIVLSGHGDNNISVGGIANVVLNGDGKLTARAIGGLNAVLTGDGASNIEADGGLNIVMAGNGYGKNLWRSGDFNLTQSVKFVMNGTWIDKDIEAQSNFVASKGYPQTFLVFCRDGIYTKAIQVQATLGQDGQVLFNQVSNSAKYWSTDVTSSLRDGVLPNGWTQVAEGGYDLVQSMKFVMNGTWINKDVEAQSNFVASKGYPQTFWVYFYDTAFTKAIQVQATLGQDGQVLFNQVSNSAKYWSTDVTSSLRDGVLPTGWTQASEGGYILSRTEGLSGIVSDYVLQTQPGGHGNFAIVKGNQNFYGVPVTGGRAGSDDAYLLIDGSQDASKSVLKQSIQLVQGKRYQFTAYVGTNDLNLPLQLQVNGRDIGSPMIAQKTTANGGWQKITTSFVAESSGTAVVGLRDLKTDWWLNDFALDDVSLREVSGGNTVRAYGVGNLVISGDGDDRIRAGSLLGMVTDTVGLTSADSFDFDSVVVVGSDITSTITKTTANLLSLSALTVTNLGNIVIAGEGNNKVKTYGALNFVQTGSGNDEISMVGGLNCVTVGNGNNKVFVIGASNWIWAGSGNDELQAIGGANVFVAGDGNNRMTALGGGNLFIGAGGNDNAFMAGLGNIFIAGGGNNSAFMIGKGNIMQAGSGDDKVIGIGTIGNAFILGDGNNTVGALGGDANIVWTGSGNDTVISIAPAIGNLLLLGDGNNFAMAAGKGNIVVTGSGKDTVLTLGQYNFISTASGIDNVVALGELNVVHTGGDDDLAVLVGKTNFLDTGWGNDIAIAIGQDNIVLTEAGNDAALVIGQNNYVFAGSGDDMVAVFGETNYVLTGSGADITLVFGKKNLVATDNEIVFTEDDLNWKKIDKTDPNNIKTTTVDLKESTTVKKANGVGSVLSKATGLDIDTQAEFKISGDLVAYFPDIEFSTANQADWKMPTFTLPQFNYQIPSMPELKSRPTYEYGTLGSYGLPQITLPQFSSPQLQIPGITIPSFSIPDIVGGSGLNFNSIKMNFFTSFNVNSDWAGLFGSSFSDLTGMPQNDGNSNKIMGQKLNVQPKLNGTVNHNGADLTGKVNVTDERSIDVIVANAENRNTAEAGATSSSKPSAYASGSTYANASVWDKTVTNDQNGSVNTTVSSPTKNANTAGTTYQLPKLSFDDIVLPNVNLNGFDMSGYSQLLGDIFSGRDFFGVTLPTFSLPDFKVSNFSLNDYLSDGGTSALTIKGRSFQLPSLQLPLIAGLNITSRLPTFSNFDFHHGSGDVALVGGGENRVMTGAGDDLTFVAGDENTLITGEGNDASLMFGKKNNFRGGAGSDWALAGGAENNIKGQDDNDLLIALGQTNKLDGGIGNDVLIAVGNTNELDGMAGDDLVVTIGKENKIGFKPDAFAGDGNDTIIALGCTNTIKAGAGEDWVLAVGLNNDIDLGSGNDLACIVGWDNKVIGDASSFDNGNDTILVAGGNNSIQGNGGNDLLLVAGLANNIDAGNGNDIVIAAGLRQKISLGDGDDIAVALGAGNAITGGLGNDVIYVAGLLNTVFAGDGNDVMFAFGGGAILNGGAGNDVYLSQGVASRVLQSKGTLNEGTAIIHAAMNALNAATQFISSEVAPDKVSDYQIQKSTGILYEISGNGSNVFYSGFERTSVQAGSGDDRFQFYLGDADMTLASGSGRDHLYIHADSNEYVGLGLNASIDSSNLYYQASTKTLSICRNNVTYGQLNLADFDSNDTVSLLMTGGRSIDVLLSSMQSPVGTQSNNQMWTPSTPVALVDSSLAPNLTTLYQQMQTTLNINSAVL